MAMVCMCVCSWQWFIMSGLAPQLKAKTTPGESDQNVRRILARQHAKDISDYTKRIHGKDRELTDLRKRMAKVCMDGCEAVCL